ncbi:MAG: mechanosensitive ion channel family protein [Kofleriaceae bacterium]|nr:mechanosensitive ion channel family protein [Kofleriaceae bacterium]
MPEWLRGVGPGGLEVWQWIGIVAVLVVAIILGRLGAWILTYIGSKLTGRTETSFDDDLVRRLRSPIRMVIATGIARLAVVPLDLPAKANGIALQILVTLFALALVWGALRAIDVMHTHLTTAQWARTRPSSRALLSLVSRVAKVLVIVIAGISFMSGLGLPVASLLAGLGIGGIALAFGAQKTVENLFGAVSIGVDQPFREGDFVRVEADVMGTIETVGLRSTRIRTLDRTVVSLPNGRLADMRIETFAPRDRIRYTTVLSLMYGTTAAQMREVLAGVEGLVRGHAGVWKDDIVVRFMGFGVSSLDIEIICFFSTADMGTFRTWKQEILLGIMDVIERAGTALAVPKRTVAVIDDRPPA